MQTRDINRQDKSPAQTAATHVRAKLRQLIEDDPENTAETLAGAFAEIVTRHIAAYGPERAAQFCEKAAKLARTAPNGGQ